MSTRITIVSAVNDTEMLKANLLASPFLLQNPDYQVLTQMEFSSAARAYNEGIDRADNDLIVFAHQDVFFPAAWLAQLGNALQYLEAVDANWGVLGCWGVTRTGETWGHIYSTGWGILGKPFESPVEVQTLDEIVLILRKSSGLRFDETLPHFHLYGTSICMHAARRRLKCYAIPAFCIHNTEQILTLPREFYNCYRNIKQVWRGQLPIYTSCIKISRFDTELWMRRLREFRLQALSGGPHHARRQESPQQIFARLEAEGKLHLLSDSI